MSQRKAGRKNRQNIENAGDSDDVVPCVTFIGDKDCTELLYLDHSKSKVIAMSQEKASLKRSQSIDDESDDYDAVLQEKNNHKRRKNIDDDNEDSDDAVPFVTFIGDKDCTELLYLEQSRNKGRRRRASSSEIDTPKHIRVAALLRETPPSRKRSNSRLATVRPSIPDTLSEEDESGDEWNPVAKPRVLFTENTVGCSPSQKLSSKKNKERMEQKIKASQEKYSSPIKNADVTPTKPEAANNMSTPRSKPGTSVDILTPRSKPGTSVDILTPRSKPGTSVDISTPRSKPGTSVTSVDTPRSKRGQASQPSSPRTPRITHKEAPSNDVLTPKSKRQEIKQSTPKTPRTAGRTTEVAKTPHVQRQNIKKNLKSMMNDEGSDESDWTIEDESESSDDSDASSTFPSPQVKTPSHSRPTTPVSVKSSSRVGLRTSARTTKSVYKSDDYFETHGTSKVVTSDKTLNLLENPRLRADILQNELMGVEIKHKNEIEKLVAEHYKMFEHWMLLLHESFNLLLHGLGSKTTLLSNFHDQMLSEKYDSIVINGYFTSLTIKDILKSIAEDIAELSNIPADEVELCDAIIAWFQSPKSEPLYLLINNLDGAMLQSSKAQSILARLAATPNIHVVATIDHVNAPLLFDQAQLSRFNFIWQDVTNFLTYTDETAFENSLLVQQTGGLALASLRNVFQSLTTNAKAIFNIIMSKQLDSTDSKYNGMSFKDLYRKSQDAFLVASESALRTHLTEFLDHQLVRIKRGHDGSDLLLIPIPKAPLLEFQASQLEM